MTDTPLLRLARIVEDIACRNGPMHAEDAARRLKEDLEAAPFPDTGLEPRGCPTPGACSCPVPAPRTITREEWDKLRMRLDWWASNWGMVSGSDAEMQMQAILRQELGLTVEDA